jgi:hypothetical protein
MTTLLSVPLLILNLLDIQNRITELMTLFVTRVKSYTAMKRTYINHVSETVLIPLLSEIYNCKNLKNLNSINANYPGVDLGDEKSRIAIQVTSTPDSTIIKHTLEKFIAYKLYEKYDRLKIYIIAEKQKKYSGNGFQEIIDNKFEFNPDHDIIDY